MPSSTRSAFTRDISRFLTDERAASVIEYALIASFIAVAISAIVLSTGSEVRDKMYKPVLDAYPS